MDFIIIVIFSRVKCDNELKLDNMPGHSIYSVFNIVGSHMDHKLTGAVSVVLLSHSVAQWLAYSKCLSKYFLKGGLSISATRFQLRKLPEFDWFTRL